jgi:hypothetical protein
MHALNDMNAWDLPLAMIQIHPSSVTRHPSSGLCDLQARECRVSRRKAQIEPE